MHYIRLLKRLHYRNDGKGKRSLETLITVRTDLGDQFYELPTTLEVDLIYDPDSPRERSSGSTYLQWTGERDVLPVSFKLDGQKLPRVCALSILPVKSREKHVEAGRFGCSRQALPAILGARTESIDLSAIKTAIERIVHRVVPLKAQAAFHIPELADDAIFGHVWDAGVAFSMCLADPELRVARLHHLDEHMAYAVANRGHVNVVELGAGCGLVGLSLAVIEPCSKVVLTDLEEAQPHLLRCISYFTNEWRDSSRMRSRVRAAHLDWNDDLSPSLSAIPFDVILVSDCTYNPDSSLALVKTIYKLSSRVSNALVVVAMKKRHDAEAIFFQHMERAKFSIVTDTGIKAPYSDELTEEKFVDEIVKLYTYRREDYNRSADSIP